MRRGGGGGGEGERWRNWASSPYSTLLRFHKRGDEWIGQSSDLLAASER